ncbi:MAG TPA: DUF2207 domain-containing protein [Rudaea sp.]|nr:DUF2207 domain-containing protein [Rudaea sp.]
MSTHRLSLIHCFAWCLLAWLAFPALGHADERILDYHADIVINGDGSMTVAEHIRVHAEGYRIRHGIYRDFPTDYRDPHGNRYVVGFDVLGAQRDGVDESWRTESRSNGVRVYLGDKNTTLMPSDHDYVLTYSTNRQLGFFPGHDELYWNVTGTDWDYPIEKASATIHLAQDVNTGALKAYGYIGVSGSQDQSVETSIQYDGASYTAARPLLAHENLSVVLEFPKGIIAPPSAWQNFRWLMHDNRNLLAGLIGLIILWLYYGFVWNAWGRDPAPAPRMPIYEPPDGDSAASLRYVRRMSYDRTCFTASVLDLAAKGCLDIVEVGGKYQLNAKDGPTATLTIDQKLHLAALFAGGSPLLLDQVNHTRIHAADVALRKVLSKLYEQKYFLTNTGMLLIGLAISLVTAFAALPRGSHGAMMPMIYIAIFSVIAGQSIATSVRSKPGIRGWLPAIPWVVIVLACFFAMSSHSGIAVPILFASLIGTNLAFYQWMKAPTQIGAKLLDGVEGFRWYLGVAEKQELDSRYKPESHPELFAAYLPYAVALDLGNAWAQRFAEALTPLQMQQAQPTWYVGGNFNAFTSSSGISTFSSGLSSAISSASVAPGSSSGGFGGSGGGGGGGGGGGW